MLWFHKSTQFCFTLWWQTGKYLRSLNLTSFKRKKFLYLWLRHSLTLTHTLLSLTASLSHSLSLSLKHTPSLSFSLSLPNSHTLTQVHTYTTINPWVKYFLFDRSNLDRAEKSNWSNCKPFVVQGLKSSWRQPSRILIRELRSFYFRNKMAHHGITHLSNVSLQYILSIWTF